MVAFLVLVELSSRVDQSLSFAMLIVRVVVPLAILVFFKVRGCYPELRLSVSRWTLIDVVIGVALAAMWITPYILLPDLRPDKDATVLDPAMAGVAWIPIVLTVRMIGYAIVTPWMEEIFMRSFLMRYVEVFDSGEDLSAVPIARFSWKSFLVVVAVFLATHLVWEWWVMLPWAVLTNLWFYYRKDLFAIIVVHAATNASILAASILLTDYWTDAAGNPISLWFFV